MKSGGFTNFFSVAGFELFGRRVFKLIEEPFRRMQNGARWKHALPEDYSK
jgi:hypothetical protein